MKKNSVLVLLAALGFMVITTGCGKIPQTEMDAANVAVDSAKKVGAEAYVPQEYAVLQDSMKAAMEEVEMQKSKTFSNYDEAAKKLTNVSLMANEVIQKAEVKKAEMIAEINTMMTEVKMMIQENNALISEAPAGKEGAAALESMKQEMGVIETSVNEASSMMQTNPEYMVIMDKTKAAKEKATSINTELKEAIAKYSKNKPKKA